MRATLMYGAGDVRVEDVPDAELSEPTDALIRVTRASVCGSDLWPYKSMEPNEGPQPMGHEAIGVVEEVGSDVRNLNAGQLVVMPFAFSDGMCAFCREGLQTACVHGGFFGTSEVGGAQAEALRVPQADGTLVPLPVSEDDALLPSLLTLSDVMGTGQHAAVVTEVGPGKTVAVVGDGAVGLCGVIAAKRLGAEQIIILGRHAERTELAREFGASDVVAERGDADGDQGRPARRCRRPGRRSPEREDAGLTACLLRQRQGRRWARTGPGVHRGAPTRRPRRQDRARTGLRPLRTAR